MTWRSLTLGVAATVASFATAGAAQAETITDNTGGPIAISDNAVATPYPGTIAIEGADGNVTDLNVRIRLSHTFPDDLDIALVSPDGDSEILMSDACGASGLVDVTFTFDSSAAGPLSDGGACASGTFQATNYAGIGTENWPAPGPGAVSTATLANFNGENPNGIWRLFVVDDDAFFTGNVADWGLTITTETAEVIVPAGPATSGLASAYPSTKAFATPAGKVISDVDFVTPDFNHTNPDDVDMLLQGPHGETVMLMSDACGADDIHDFSWTFSDSAVALMSDDVITGCNPFTIKPSDFGSPETMPPPAPVRPYASSLSVFNGLKGGDWRLYVNDDSAGGTGFLTIWNLAITTRDPATTAFAAPTASATEGETATLEVSRSGPPVANLGPATLDIAVDHVSSDAADLVNVPAQLQFAPGQTSKAVSIPVVDDGAAESDEAFTVTLRNPANDALLAGTTVTTVTIGASAAAEPPADPPVDPPVGPPLTPGGPPNNQFTLGKTKRLGNGSAELSVTVPGAGTLSVADAQKLIKPTSASATSAGTVILTLKPSKAAKRKLKQGKKVKLTAEVTYTPTGGSSRTAEAPVKLKKKAPKP